MRRPNWHATNLLQALVLQLGLFQLLARLRQLLCRRHCRRCVRLRLHGAANFAPSGRRQGACQRIVDQMNNPRDGGIIVVVPGVCPKHAGGYSSPLTTLGVGGMGGGRYRGWAVWGVGGVGL